MIGYNLVVRSVRGRVKAVSTKGGRVRARSQSHVPSASLHAMSAASLAPYLLLLCLVAGTSQLSIKDFVVPKTVEIGNDAELRCQYELQSNETEVALFVKWWWTPSSGSSDDRRLVYQRISGHPPDLVQHVNASKRELKDKETDTIVLKEVRPADSGTYQCEVSNIDEVRMHETLLIFSQGLGPEINYTFIKSEAENEADKLYIECEAEDIAPLPDITLVFQDKQLNISKIVEDPDEDGLYRILANATIEAGNDESEIRCEVFYKNMEHTPFVDVETFTPPGSEASTTTEVYEITTDLQSTTDPLSNDRDDGVRLHSSWLTLWIAAVLTCLHSIL